MYEIISGALMMACLVASLFFVKFWRKSRDLLFLMFALAFIMLSLERFVLGYMGVNNEAAPQVYLIRLMAFLLILIAIVHKNRTTNLK